MEVVYLKWKDGDRESTSESRRAKTWTGERYKNMKTKFLVHESLFNLYTQ